MKQCLWFGNLNSSQSSINYKFSILIDISVIIVNYNVKELLEECIRSVLNSSVNLNVEIIVVDNNSFDGSIQYIKEKFPNENRLKIIESPINLGFAKANNLGSKEANGEYLLILNPDTILQEDTLEKTLKFYKNSEKTGAVTCKLILPTGKLDLACRRSFPTPSVAVYRILGLSKLFPNSKTFGKYNLTYLDENDTYEVDAIVGAFMFIKKRIYDEVNGFDEDYFMYGEDLDLCFRIKKAGYKIYYYPQTSIIHYKGESTKKSSISYVNNFYGAMQVFVKKNLNTSFWLMNFLIKISIFYRAAISYVTRFFRNNYPFLLDLISIVGSIFIAIYLRFEFFPLDAYTLVIFVYTIIWLLSLLISGSYNKIDKFTLVKPLYGILLGFFINSSFTYFFNEYAFSRAVVLRTTINAYLFIALWRLAAKVIRYSKSRGIFRFVNTLIVGRNKETENFISKLKTRVDTEYEFIGYISPSSEHSAGFIGNLNNLRDIVTSFKVKNLIFAKNAMSSQDILNTMWSLRELNISFKILTGDSDIILGKSTLDKIDDIYLMQIEYNINKKFNIFVKRSFDLLFGIFSLFTVYPAILIASKIDSLNKNHNKFFKKIRLIPGVVTGKLSFVGRATWDIPQQGMQYLGKNGLTGLVQINLHRNLSADEIEYFNFYYAKNQNLTLDLEILLKTISLFIFRKNIQLR
ncbi:MAG: glycosyltransferase [Ignavibacteria bacterium]|nr:glycosyltransferase [Ignavibacteria bacterium]